MGGLEAGECFQTAALRANSLKPRVEEWRPFGRLSGFTISMNVPTVRQQKTVMFLGFSSIHLYF